MNKDDIKVVAPDRAKAGDGDIAVSRFENSQMLDATDVNLAD